MGTPTDLDPSRSSWEDWLHAASKQTSAGLLACLGHSRCHHCRRFTTYPHRCRDCEITLCRHCPSCPRCHKPAAPAPVRLRADYGTCQICHEPMYLAGNLDDDHDQGCLPAATARQLVQVLGHLQVQAPCRHVPLQPGGWAVDLAAVRGHIVFTGHGLVMYLEVHSGARVGRLVVLHSLRNCQLRLTMSGPHRTQSTQLCAIQRTHTGMKIILARQVDVMAITVVAPAPLPAATYHSQSPCAWRLQLEPGTNVAAFQYLEPVDWITDQLTTGLHLLLASRLSTQSPHGVRTIWRVCLVGCIPYFYFITDRTKKRLRFECILCGRAYDTVDELATRCFGVAVAVLLMATPMRLWFEHDHQRVCRLDPGLTLSQLRDPADIAEYRRFHWSYKTPHGLRIEGVLPAIVEPKARFAAHDVLMDNGRRAATLAAYVVPLLAASSPTWGGPYAVGEAIFTVRFTTPIKPLEQQKNFPAFILAALAQACFPRTDRIAECLVFDILPGTIDSLQVVAWLLPDKWEKNAQGRLVKAIGNMEWEHHGSNARPLAAFFAGYRNHWDRVRNQPESIRPVAFRPLVSRYATHSSYMVLLDNKDWPTCAICRT